MGYRSSGALSNAQISIGDINTNTSAAAAAVSNASRGMFKPLNDYFEQKRREELEAKKYNDLLKQQSFENRLATERAKREKEKFALEREEFNTKMDDRNATMLFNKAFNETKGLIAPDKINQAVSKDQVDDMAYTKDEIDAIKGTTLSDNYDSMRKELKNKNIKSNIIDNIIRKTKMQNELGKLIQNPDSDTTATRTQRAAWALQDVQDKYGYVPDAVQAKYNTIYAGEQAALKSKRESIIAQLNQTQKEADNLLLKLTEYKNKKNKSDSNDQSVIKKIIDIKTLGNEMGWNNILNRDLGTDAAEAMISAATVDGKYVDTDKLKYLANNAKLSNGDYITNKESYKKIANEYERTKNKGQDPLDLLLTKRYNNSAQQAKKLSEKLKALDKSPEEVQLYNLKDSVAKVLNVGNVGYNRTTIGGYKKAGGSRGKKSYTSGKNTKKTGGSIEVQTGDFNIDQQTNQDIQANTIDTLKNILDETKKNIFSEKNIKYMDDSSTIPQQQTNQDTRTNQDVQTNTIDTLKNIFSEKNIKYMDDSSTIPQQYTHEILIPQQTNQVDKKINISQQTKDLIKQLNEYNTRFTELSPENTSKKLDSHGNDVREIVKELSTLQKDYATKKRIDRTLRNNIKNSSNEKTIESLNKVREKNQNELDNISYGLNTLKQILSETQYKMKMLNQKNNIQEKRDKILGQLKAVIDNQYSRK